MLYHVFMTNNHDGETVLPLRSVALLFLLLLHLFSFHLLPLLLFRSFKVKLEEHLKKKEKCEQPLVCFSGCPGNQGAATAGMKHPILCMYSSGEENLRYRRN